MQLNLLGKTELFDDAGLRVPLPTKKVFLVLAMLSMAKGKPLTRSFLCDHIWPNATHEAARSSLRNALAALRKALGDSAILASDDQITLVKGHVACDAANFQKCEDHLGDFMPGFNEDWVLDERLNLRLLAVEDGLSRVDRFVKDKKLSEAFELLELATKIDPLNQDVVEQKIEVLKLQGRTPEAIRTADSFQGRVLRDLGVVLNLESQHVAPLPAQHPLITTGEWLLDRNPEEAMSFLAATRSSWFAMGGKEAMDLHGKVLQASIIESQARKIVEAQKLYLMWINGKFDVVLSSTQQAFDEALNEGNLEVASILGSALSYGLLSSGQFNQALKEGKKLCAFAQRSKDISTIVKNERSLSIIEQHTGHYESWESRVHTIKHLSDQINSPEENAHQNLIMILINIRNGKYDEAALNQAKSLRFFQSGGGMRMVAYSLLGKAELLEAIGSFSEALEVLGEIRAMGEDTIGHSLAASIDDSAARIYARMSELDIAAESLARSTLLRRSIGSKASLYESTTISPTRRLLKEKLGEQDIRAAFSRARLSNSRVAV